MKRKCHFALLVVLTVASVGHSSKFDIEYQWKSIDFVWKSQTQKQNAIAAGNYNASANVPYDVDKMPDGRYIVTIVRAPGVPATLATISKQSGPGGPLLQPYPNWRWNTQTNCDGITSVYRVTICCNTLWVIDNGKNGEDQVCPPQVLGFDVYTDRLVFRKKIPLNVATNAQGTGLLVNVITYNPWCMWSVPKMYIPDVEGKALVVYDGESFRRLESYAFQSNPNYTNFTLIGGSFTLDDGILPITLKVSGDPELYWRPFAGNALYHAKLKDIDKSKNVLPNNVISGVTDINYRSAAMAVTNRGYLITSELENYAISYWNTALPYKSNKHLIEKNETTLQFATGMKIIDQKIWVITNRLQTFSTNNQNLNEINFRILTCPLKRALCPKHRSRN